MMNPTDERIRQAIDLIGDGDGDDYVLAPSSHATLYADAAPELAYLLRRSEVQVSAERYEDLDQRARDAQARFFTTSARARAAVLLTGVSAALLLASAPLSAWVGMEMTALVLLATLAGVVAGNLAAMWIRAIRNEELLETWMKRRAEAETERRRYFTLVTAGNESVDPLLQLEYFRRYHLDVQRAFYRRRERDHSLGATRTLRRGSAAIAIGGIGTGIAGGLAAALDNPAFLNLALLALAAQAAAVYFENQEMTQQHRRNAERYHRTRNVLLELYGQLDLVRAATAAGDPETVPAYVASVHEPLEAEHREWLDEMRSAGEAVERLHSLLEEHRARAEALGGQGHAGAGALGAGAAPFIDVSEVAIAPPDLDPHAEAGAAYGYEEDPGRGGAPPER